MLLKKLFVDNRKEEEGLWQLSAGEYIQLKEAITSSLNFGGSTLSLLKRKADLICACYREIKNYPELILSLVNLLQSQEGEQV